MKLLSGNGSQTLMNQKKMRKFSSFMAAAVAMLAAVSCNKEINNIDPVTPGADAVVYTAYVDGAETKTSLGATEGEGDWEKKTTRTQWDANDQITIHNGTQGYTFTASEINGGSAKFEYDKQNGEYEAGEGVMAVYPAGNYTVNVENKTVNAYIPTWQQAQIGTYHSPAALAIAYSENNALQFKNATALLKFTVNTDNVTHVVFHGNKEEAITGNAQVTLGSEGVEVTCLETEFTQEQWNDELQETEKVNVTKYGTWVECYAYHDDANKYFVKGKEYYIAVAPQVFDDGVTIKIRINDGDELVAKTTTKKVETKANTILDLRELEYTEPVVHEWAIAGTFNEWNTTANPMTKDGDYYVLKGVTGLNFTQDVEKEDGVSSTGIKFVINGNTWKGGEGKAVAGTWAYVWGDGNNIYVEGAAAETAYDIYVNPAEGENGKFVIVAAGNAMPEDKPAEEPEVTEITVYFKPNKTLVSSAKSFAAWVWSETIGAKWYMMTDSDSDGVYEVTIPNTLTQIIFAAMNSTTADWNNKTYQTADLSVPSDDNNCYLVATDKWVTLDAAKAYVEQTPYRFYVQNNTDYKTIAFYTWGGTYQNGWPGDVMSNTADVPGYGTCEYVEIPYGKTIVNFIINNNGGGKQTSDLVVSKNATKLDSGDYIYVLSSL